MKKIIAFLFAASFFIFSFISTRENSPEKLISLQLINIAGESPKVFTSGWVFGVKGILHPESPYAEDISGKIHWTGTGKFFPEYGSETRPVFEKTGLNTIIVEYEFNGSIISKSFEVYTVLPDIYACVGDYAFCHACSHGCIGCPHQVVGPITSGSPNVTVRDKPAARIGDGGIQAMCCGNNSFTISEGDSEVLIDGKPAAKIGSATIHCGGKGIIIGDNYRKSTDDNSSNKVNNPYGIKEGSDKSNPNVYFPGERLPLEGLLKVCRPPNEFSADNILKEQGPDYDVSAKQIFEHVNNIFGFEGSALTLLEELGNLDCIKNINEVCGKLGVLFSVIQVMDNVYEGKNTEALGNTFKGAGYWAMGAYGWSALKIASVGIFIFDYTINRFISEMIELRYNTYKQAYYRFYSDDSKVKRNHKKWFSVVEQIYTDSKLLNQDFKSRLEDEIGSYLSKFWNSDNSSFYLPPGGFIAELSQEDKKAIMDTYRKEILNPVLNAVMTGIMQRERIKIDEDVNKKVTEMAKLYNTKFPFLVKVNGTPDKIKKIKVRIGEWSGYTDEKGLWKFDATLYAFLKNRKPDVAFFTIAEDLEVPVEFKLKEKGTTEIILESPKPVSIDLKIETDKNTEGARFTASATLQNLVASYYFGSDGGFGSWDWYINGIQAGHNEQLFSTDLKEIYHQDKIEGVLESAKEYEFEVRLTNADPNHKLFNKTIATAKKKIIIQADKNKNVVTNERKEKEEVYVPPTGTDFDYPQGRHPVIAYSMNLDNCSENTYQATFSVPAISNGNGIFANVSNSGFSVNFSNQQGSDNEVLSASGSFRHVPGRKGLYTSTITFTYRYNFNKDSYFEAKLSGESMDFNSASTIVFNMSGTYNYVNTMKKINCSSTVKDVTFNIRPEVK